MGESPVRCHDGEGSPASPRNSTSTSLPIRSTADAIATVLHTAASHKEGLGNYVRMLFVDFSSAFNTILPSILFQKLTDLGFP